MGAVAIDEKMTLKNTEAGEGSVIFKNGVYGTIAEVDGDNFWVFWKNGSFIKEKRIEYVCNDLDKEAISVAVLFMRDIRN